MPFLLFATLLPLMLFGAIAAAFDHVWAIAGGLLLFAVISAVMVRVLYSSITRVNADTRQADAVDAALRQRTKVVGLCAALIAVVLLALEVLAHR
jgi:hypothetical protein